MKAWITYNYGDMRLEEVPSSKPGPGWVTVKVEVCQASISDVIRAKGIETSGSDKIKKMISEKAPVQLFGHEFCGRIVELGDTVKGFCIGDRVTARNGVSCGECHECVAGHDENCRNVKKVGEETPGVFAEYVNLPASVLAKVPNSMTSWEGACMQPLAAAVSFVNSVQIPMGATVAILGQGVIGLYVLQIARVSGVGVSFACDIRPEPLALAKQFGADYIVNSGEVDPVTYVIDKTDGRGVDIVFECAGGSEADGLSGFKTLDQAFRMVKFFGGIVVQCSHLQFGKTFPFSLKILREKCTHWIFPSKTSSQQMKHAIHLVDSKRVDVNSLITHRLEGLENLLKAFEITTNKKAYKAINPAQIRVSAS
jgi:threonine dehydrogenase-like Zn-dependent dehydrogenase